METASVPIDFLKEHSLFGGISNENLEKISPFLKTVFFAKGEEVIKEGDTDNHLYLIYKGSVEILKKVPDSENRNRERIAVLGEGDTFGEMELIDIQPRSATVRTLEDTVALTLASSDLHRIAQSDLHTFSFIVMNIAREISRRLRKMDDLVANLLYVNLKKKK